MASTPQSSADCDDGVAQACPPSHSSARDAAHASSVEADDEVYSPLETLVLSLMQQLRGSDWIAAEQAKASAAGTASIFDAATASAGTATASPAPSVVSVSTAVASAAAPDVVPLLAVDAPPPAPPAPAVA